MGRPHVDEDPLAVRVRHLDDGPQHLQGELGDLAVAIVVDGLYGVDPILEDEAADLRAGFLRVRYLARGALDEPIVPLVDRARGMAARSGEDGADREDPGREQSPLPLLLPPLEEGVLHPAHVHHAGDAVVEVGLPVESVLPLGELLRGEKPSRAAPDVHVRVP